ncbi:hypothetical protein ACFL1Q_02855 [Patescibacteria group bacterium]
MDKDKKIPYKSETIAAKRAIRLAEKIKQTREIISTRKAWWSNTFLEVFFLLIVFCINLYHLLPVFGTSSLDVPFSGPVMPLLAKLVAYIFKTQPLMATQSVSIFFFLVFPFTLYLLVKKITSRKLVGFTAIFVCTLPIYMFAATRIKEAFFGLDVSHMAGLSIMPLSLWGLLSFLKEGKIKNMIVAVFSSAVLALTSPFAFANFLVFAAIFTFSEMLLGQGRLKLLRSIAVFAFAGGLSSFWYNPAFFVWMITGPFGEGIRATIAKIVPISFFTLPILLAFGYLLFDRKPRLQPVFIASFCTIVFLMVLLTSGGDAFSATSRYLPELGISLALLSGVLLTKTVDLIVIKEMKVLANIGTFLVFSLMFAVTIFNGNKLFEDETNVLGYFTDIQKNELWQARDNFGGESQTLGSVITFITLTGLGVLVKKEV